MASQPPLRLRLFLPPLAALLLVTGWGLRLRQEGSALELEIAARRQRLAALQQPGASATHLATLPPGLRTNLLTQPMENADSAPAQARLIRENLPAEEVPQALANLAPLIEKIADPVKRQELRQRFAK